LLCTHPVGTAVPVLLDRAVRGQSGGADNTTAIALHWEGDSADEMLSSLTLPDGAFASTIVARMDETASERELTEEDIERTIQEIRKAIEQSNAR
jgi:2,4-dienoyl-CoA reductase-like NADH-dependent reductase (Old Yellow Enzyme family)